jgi:predicted nuclease of predicted toxin-antitoxin system
MSGISLYLDEGVRVLLAEVLRSRGYNASHVLEVKRTGRSDAEQLAYAVEHGMAGLLFYEKIFCLGFFTP